MNIETHIDKDVLIVQVSGKRLDAQTAVAFKQELLHWIASFEQTKTSEDKAPRIILNFATVEFIDSSGIGALVSVLKHVGRRGDLVLCQVGETLMGAFRLTRMDRVFRIYPTEAEALNSL